MNLISFNDGLYGDMEPLSFKPAVAVKRNSNMAALVELCVVDILKYKHLCEERQYF